LANIFGLDLRAQVLGLDLGLATRGLGLRFAVPGIGLAPCGFVDITGMGHVIIQCADVLTIFFSLFT